MTSKQEKITKLLRLVNGYNDEEGLNSGWDSHERAYLIEDLITHPDFPEHIIEAIIKRQE